MSEILNQMKQISKLPINNNQKKFYDFFIENAEVFTEREAFVSNRIMKMVKQKACYNNSFYVAYSGAGEYYDGFYITNTIGLALNHAFNKLPDNKIIDVTAQKFDIDVKEWAGVKIPLEVVKDFFNSKYCGILTPLSYYYKTHIKQQHEY